MNKVKKMIFTSLMIAGSLAFIGYFAVSGYCRERLRTYSTGIMDDGKLCLAFDENTTTDEARQVKTTNDEVLKFERSTSFLTSPFTRHTAWIYSPNTAGYTDILFPNSTGGHCLYHVRVDEDMKIRFVYGIDDVPEGRKDLHNEVISVTFNETGGEDGRHNNWALWQDDGKYMISLERENGYIEKNYGSCEKEISKEDYDIMTRTLGYYACLEDIPEDEDVCDAVCYDTVITFEDGTETETKNYIPPLHSWGYDMIVKYKEETT